MNSENLEDTLIKIDEHIIKRKSQDSNDQASDTSTKHDTNETDIKVPDGMNFPVGFQES